MHKETFLPSPDGLHAEVDVPHQPPQEASLCLLPFLHSELRLHPGISATKVTQEQFDQWWNLYDKKLDKKKAFSLFKSALKKHEFETIMNGTKDYLKTITDKQYQKYPKTFLSQESYMNDYSKEIPSDNKNSGNSFYEQFMNGEA